MFVTIAHLCHEVDYQWFGFLYISTFRSGMSNRLTAELIKNYIGIKIERVIHWKSSWDSFSLSDSKFQSIQWRWFTVFITIQLSVKSSNPGKRIPRMYTFSHYVRYVDFSCLLIEKPIWIRLSSTLFLCSKVIETWYSNYSTWFIILIRCWKSPDSNTGIFFFFYWLGVSSRTSVAQ